MSKKSLQKIASVGIIGLSLLPLLVFAQGAAPGAGSQPGVPGVPGPLVTSKSQISTIVINVVNFIAGLLFVVGAGMLIWSAILYMTAGGSEDRVGRAKNYLIYAVIGIVIGVLALSVEPFIENFFRTTGA